MSRILLNTDCPKLKTITLGKYSLRGEDSYYCSLQLTGNIDYGISHFRPSAIEKAFVKWLFV